MTIAELTDQKVKEAKEDFHYYIKELGLERAKKIILRDSVLNEVKRYVNDYKGD